MRTRLPVLILCLLLQSASIALAQDAFQQMTDLLERGLYNTAALVTGPTLVEEHPGDPLAFELYARALLLSGDFEGARTALDQMYRLLGPGVDETTERLHLSGLVLASEGDSSTAAGLLEEAFSRSGSYRHAMDWARIAWQAGDVDSAERAYRAAADTPAGAREPWPWLDLGRLLLFQDRHDEAEAAFEQAISVYESFDTGVDLPSPAYVEAFHRLGQLAELRYRDSGSEAARQEAMNNYRSALVGDPNYTPAQTALRRLEEE